MFHVVSHRAVGFDFFQCQYHGCKAEDNHIIGLCFKKYRISLCDEFNPGHLNKTAFQETQGPSPENALRYLNGIEAGLKHLHSLGLVHNDINPSNIMLDEDDEAVIIDFDSCSTYGTSLATTKRTYGWYDEEI